MRWMFGFGVIFGLAASVFLIIFTLAFYPSAEQILPSKTYEFFKDILGPVAAGFGGAIAGAVMGAIANARVQEKFEHNKAAIAKTTSYNLGLIILISMYRELATLKKDLVIPVKDEPLRFVLMPVTHDINISSDRATDAMSILISTLGLTELLSDLILAEQSYVAAMNSLIERNRMIREYREAFDNAMSKKRGRQRAGLKELVEIHGRTSVLRLYDYSEATISGLDRSLVRLNAVMARLNAELAPMVQYKSHILLGLTNTGEYLTPAPSPKYSSADELSLAITEAISDTKK